MKNKLLKITILTMILITYLQISIFASTLKLNLTANKGKLKVGEEVKITVSWNEEMQAADFSLLYDAKKLEYVGSELEDYFINSTDGEVKTAWFSVDNIDKAQIEYTFKAKKSGTVKIATKINGGFATGELQVPEKYEDAKLKIRIGNEINLIIILIAFVFVVVFALLIIFRKKKNILH